MFFVPAWITNFILLGVAWLSGYHMLQMHRVNPLTLVQFWIIPACLAVTLAVAWFNRVNPWLSMGFCAVAIGILVFIVRQHRMLPPRKRI